MHIIDYLCTQFFVTIDHDIRHTSILAFFKSTPQKKTVSKQGSNYVSKLHTSNFRRQ